MSSFSVSCGYSFFNTNASITKDLDVAYVTSASYSNQSKVFKQPNIKYEPTAPQVTFGIGYRFYLKKFVNVFSYINSQLFITTSVIKSKKSIQINNNQASNEGGINVGLSENYDYQINNDKINSYVMKLSTPILLYDKWLLLEFSFNAGLVNLKSDGFYKYNMKQIESYYTGTIINPSYYSHTIATGKGNGKIDLNGNYLIYYPTLDIRVETLWGINLIMNGGIKSFSLSVEHFL